MIKLTITRTYREPVIHHTGLHIGNLRIPTAFMPNDFVVMGDKLAIQDLVVAYESGIDVLTEEEKLTWEIWKEGHPYFPDRCLNVIRLLTNTQKQQLIFYGRNGY